MLLSFRPRTVFSYTYIRAKFNDSLSYVASEPVLNDIYTSLSIKLLVFDLCVFCNFYRYQNAPQIRGNYNVELTSVSKYYGFDQLTFCLHLERIDKTKGTKQLD